MFSCQCCYGRRDHREAVWEKWAGKACDNSLLQNYFQLQNFNESFQVSTLWRKINFIKYSIFTWIISKKNFQYTTKRMMKNFPDNIFTKHSYIPRVFLFHFLQSLYIILLVFHFHSRGTKRKTQELKITIKLS